MSVSLTKEVKSRVNVPVSFNTVVVFLSLSPKKFIVPGCFTLAVFTVSVTYVNHFTTPFQHCCTKLVADSRPILRKC